MSTFCKVGLRGRDVCAAKLGEDGLILLAGSWRQQAGASDTAIKSNFLQILEILAYIIQVASLKNRGQSI